MPLYKYQIYHDQSGKKSGCLLASSKQEALQILNSYGYRILQLQVVYCSFFYFQNSLSRQNVLHFLKELHLILNSGINIITALKIMQAETHSRYWRIVLPNLIQTLSLGQSLSQALKINCPYFPPYILALLHLGEESGAISNFLQTAIRQLQQQQDFRQQFKQALIYPTFLFLATAVSTVVLFLFVLPNFVSIFQTLSIPLPNYLQFFLNINSKHLLCIFITLFVTSIPLIFFLKRPSIQYQIIHTLLQHSYGAKLITPFIYGEFALLIHGLLRADVLLEKALSLLVKYPPNPYLKTILPPVLRLLQKGIPLSAAFSRYTNLPPLLKQMLIIGENTGNLTSALEQVSIFYIHKTKRWQKNFLKLLEPILLIVFASFITGLLFLLFLPLFSLFDTINL